MGAKWVRAGADGFSIAPGSAWSVAHLPRLGCYEQWKPYSRRREQSPGGHCVYGLEVDVVHGHAEEPRHARQTGFQQLGIRQSIRTTTG